jgi:hypothetical protein
VLIIVVVIQGARQLIWVLHLGVGVRAKVLVAVATAGLVLVGVLVGADGDAAGTPLGPAGAIVGGSIAVAASSQSRSALLVVVVGIETLDTKDSVEKPAPSHVIGVDNAAVSELDALAGVVDPGKVNIECCLDDTEDDRHGVWFVMVGIAPNPVGDVQRAVGTKCQDIARVDDGRYSRLSKEKQLGKNGNRFEDFGEVPEPLDVNKSDMRLPAPV